jgi:hypothetical protein
MTAVVAAGGALVALVVFVVSLRGRTGRQVGRRAVQTPPRALPLRGGSLVCPPERGWAAVASPRKELAARSLGEGRRRRRGRRGGLLDLTVLSRGRR